MSRHRLKGRRRDRRFLVKRECWIYLISFLIGCIIINVLGSGTWEKYSILNRYSLNMISFESILYDTYFVQIVILRLKTAVGLWIAAKLVPKKLVVVVFASVISAMLGAIASMAMLANGLWGSLFFVCAVLPHGLFYATAFILWSNRSQTYSVGIEKSENWIAIVIIFIIILIGCICEAYVSPFFIEKLIKS